MTKRAYTVGALKITRIPTIPLSDVTPTGYLKFGLGKLPANRRAYYAEEAISDVSTAQMMVSRHLLYTGVMATAIKATKIKGGTLILARYEGFSGS